MNPPRKLLPTPNARAEPPDLDRRRFIRTAAMIAAAAELALLPAAMTARERAWRAGQRWVS